MCIYIHSGMSLSLRHASTPPRWAPMAGTAFNFFKAVQSLAIQPLQQLASKRQRLAAGEVGVTYGA